MSTTIRHPEAPERVDPDAPEETPDELREAAVERLRKRQDFHLHLMIYLLVNAFLWIVWAITTPGDYPWPIWPTAAWGIGVAANAYDVYMRRPFSEADIRAEMDRLRRT